VAFLGQVFRAGEKEKEKKVIEIMLSRETQYCMLCDGNLSVEAKYMKKVYVYVFIGQTKGASGDGNKHSELCKSTKVKL